MLHGENPTNITFERGGAVLRLWYRIPLLLGPYRVSWRGQDREQVDDDERIAEGV